LSEVILGVDPAKRSHTVAVIDGREQLLATLRIDNSNDGYRQLRAFALRWPKRRWAVEGAAGVGCQLAQRLVADGEQVVDVPAKLSVRARIFAIGHGRKNDPADALTVAVVALRTAGLTPVGASDETVALRLLSDRRRELVRARTQAVNRLHQQLMDLIPGGAPQRLTATGAKQLLASVRPKDPAGRARRALATDLIDDVAVFDRKLRDLDKRLAESVAATGSGLLEHVGVGTVTAALILGEVGDIRRFPSKDHFASYTGTAPLEVSSGEVVRHRLSRAGNRRLNHALHIIALAHKRHDPRGQAYYARKLATGKGSKGALRCLKRRLSDVIYRQLIADQKAAEAGPEGHPGATTKSSAADPTPTASSSDKSLTGPAAQHATPPSLAAS
jgi:transposase